MERAAAFARGRNQGRGRRAGLVCGPARYRRIRRAGGWGRGGCSCCCSERAWSRGWWSLPGEGVPQAGQNFHGSTEADHRERQHGHSEHQAEDREAQGSGRPASRRGRVIGGGHGDRPAGVGPWGRRGRALRGSEGARWGAGGVTAVTELVRGRRATGPRLRRGGSRAASGRRRASEGRLRASHEGKPARRPRACSRLVVPKR